MPQSPITSLQLQDEGERALKMNFLGEGGAVLYLSPVAQNIFMEWFQPFSLLIGNNSTVGKQPKKGKKSKHGAE